MVRKSVIGMCAAMLVVGLGLLNADSASASWGPASGSRSSGFAHRGFGNAGYGYQNFGNPWGYGYGHAGHPNRRGDDCNRPRFDNRRPTINIQVNPGRYDFRPGGFHNYR